MQTSDVAGVALLDVKSKASHSPVAAAALITWMNRHEMANIALEWGLSLPKQTVETQPVPLAIGESYSFLQDWNGLRLWVDGKDWGDHECFRLAVLSHALHHLGPTDRPSVESQTVWRAALKASKSRPEWLVAIAQLAERLGLHRRGRRRLVDDCERERRCEGSARCIATPLLIEEKQPWSPARRTMRVRVESGRSSRSE